MAGGKIIRRTLTKSFTEVDGNFDGFYKNLSMNAGDNNTFKAKTTNHGNPKKEPKIGKHFVKGWWTNHRNEPIKRAIYGQVLRFHIEMDKIYTKSGDIVYFAMFDSDMRTFGNDVVKADDAIGLVYKDGSGKPYTWEKVDTENKVVIEFSTTDSLEQWTTALDEDKIFELYFRCSYVNHGNVEHKELPYNFHDYLSLGSIVIDRYKMPGLNEDGTNIAEDMAYGTGYPYKSPIYDFETLKNYKDDYLNFGFDINLHSEFANIETKVISLEEVVVVGKANPKLNEKYSLPRREVEIDNTKVVKQYQFSSIEELEKQKMKLNEENEKSIYNRPTIIELGKLMKLTSRVEKEGFLWTDFKILKESLVWGDLSPILDQLIAKFKSNTGGVYESSILTENIKNADSTMRYCSHIENYISEKLKSKFSNLELVEEKNVDWDINIGSNEELRRNKDKITGEKNKDGKMQTFSTPLFPYDRWSENNLFEGRTLSLNDIWATEVILQQVLFDGENYVAKYQVTLWDHFGLDMPDMLKFFYNIAGFRAWFVLQHLKGYKPFITKTTFTKEYNGKLSDGRNERIAERNALEQIQSENANRIEELRQIGRKKPGEM